MSLATTHPVGPTRSASYVARLGTGPLPDRATESEPAPLDVADGRRVEELSEGVDALPRLNLLVGSVRSLPDDQNTRLAEREGRAAHDGQHAG